MENFRINAVPSAGTCTLFLSGEADQAVAGNIVDVGTASLEHTTLLVIDLADLTFLDSTALGALVELHHVAEAARKHLVLSRTPGLVQQLLALTGQGEVFVRQVDLPAPAYPAAPDNLAIEPNPKPTLPTLPGPRAWGSYAPLPPVL
jgi:anti-sigma B factor antagonist